MKTAEQKMQWSVVWMILLISSGLTLYMLNIAKAAHDAAMWRIIGVIFPPLGVIMGAI